ncbi:MAG: gamma-glutamyltransferase [Candidimonas sp.]|nr:gamma-glutamyltransferase [Candidimonas sp.]
MKLIGKGTALTAWLAVLVLAGCTGWPIVDGQASAPQEAPAATAAFKEDIAPEAASGRVARHVVRAKDYMLVSAHPLATRAGARILADGGTAIDAVIASQMVLTLVEPQSSGIGGGAFIVSYDKASQTMQTYDGRETAPAAARADRYMQEGAPIEFWDAVHSGLSVGVPGVLHALALAHADHGRMDWASLFAPAITLAEEGFAVTPRLHTSLEANHALRDQPDAAAYFYDPAGRAWPVGHWLRNPALAQTLRLIAQDGPQAFYRGRIAEDIVAAVARHAVPGDLTVADMAGYRALRREPLCAPYEVYEVCGMPPPSSGPLAVIQMLNILSHTPISSLAPQSLAAVHLFSEAGKLAFADRDYYVADPAYVDVPVEAMISPSYLALRAALIDPTRSQGSMPPGDPAGMRAVRGRDNSAELPSTTHVVAVDRAGNVVSMTSSIETAFGSKIFVDGFLLNNQLTDFSFASVDAQGRPVANRIEAGKRPRSSMAPMIVMHQGQPVMAIGAPGGAAIINYVAKTILGVLDWGLDIQAAISLPNFGNRNRYTELERGTALHSLAAGLQTMGHEVREVDATSGLHGIVLTPSGLEGGADPRREGLAMGE